MDGFSWHVSVLSVFPHWDMDSTICKGDTPGRMQLLPIKLRNQMDPEMARRMCMMISWKVEQTKNQPMVGCVTKVPQV